MFARMATSPRRITGSGARKTLWRVLNLVDGPVLTHISQTRKGGTLSIKLSRGVSKQERLTLVEQITRMLRLDEN